VGFFETSEFVAQPQAGLVGILSVTQPVSRSPGRICGDGGLRLLQDRQLVLCLPGKGGVEFPPEHFELGLQFLVGDQALPPVGKHFRPFSEHIAGSLGVVWADRVAVMDNDGRESFRVRVGRPQLAERLGQAGSDSARGISVAADFAHGGLDLFCRCPEPL
jgi:hypothetical protein